MRHINLDQEQESVRQFVLGLQVDPDGSLLELAGEPVLRVLPVAEEPVDAARLKAAILARRNESRRLNEEWEHVDREAWENIAENGE